MDQAHIKEIINEVTDWFYEAPEDQRQEFLACAFDKLVNYHHTLGREIRNEFGLWQESWIPDLVDGIDMSPEHPDAVSMYIIGQVWKKLHE